VKTLLLLLVSLPAFAQGTFYGAGLSLLPQSSPKPTGWAASVITISATQRIYNINEVDFTEVGNFLKHQPVSLQTSARIGGLAFIRSFGSGANTVDLYGLLDGGFATTGATTSGALATGGILLIPTKWPDIKIVLGVRVLKTAAETTTLGEFGLKWGNGK